MQLGFNQDFGWGKFSLGYDKGWTETIRKHGLAKRFLKRVKNLSESKKDKSTFYLWIKESFALTVMKVINFFGERSFSQKPGRLKTIFETRLHFTWAWAKTQA